MRRSYYNRQVGSVGQKILEMEACKIFQEAHLSHLTLQLFDCVQLALPAVLCGHLVLPAAPDVAAQLHLKRVFVKICSVQIKLEFLPDQK